MNQETRDIPPVRAKLDALSEVRSAIRDVVVGILLIGCAVGAACLGYSGVAGAIVIVGGSYFVVTIVRYWIRAIRQR